MSPGIRSLIRISGITVIVIGLAMILTFIVSLLCGEFRRNLCFIWIGLSLIAAGYAARIICKPRQTKIHIGDGFFIVTILWTLMSLAGALPYIVTGTIEDPAGAIFESCSGFTTTGATTLDELHRLPHSILFWRAMTGWLGGIGILLIAITLMPALGLNGQRLNTPDNYGPVLEQISPKMIDSIRRICLIYTGLTLVETILLTLSGMSLFNGLLHSMSTVSTGGFARYDDGIAHFGSYPVLLIISCFMILSGLNYHLLLHRPKNGIRSFFQSSEIRLYGALLGGSFILVSFFLMVRGHLYPLEAICCGIFQSASFLTTTGFVGGDYDHWPQICQMIFLLLMFCGACTASAGSGLKVARVAILLKLVRRGVSARLHANFFDTIKMNGQGMSSEMISGAATMPFLTMVALFTTSLLLTFGDVSLSTAFNASAACLCNTGHAFGSLGASGSFMDFGSASKYLLSLLMIGGRLELYAIVILLTPRFWTQGH